jgi:hypothetical protein
MEPETTNVRLEMMAAADMALPAFWEIGYWFALTVCEGFPENGSG